uniref:Uncharacterized protein n=1 Tax=Tanacetum cinerariifolium TaxID=118510 RepID=A0A699JFH1_TANCI|nr:hypothetical protein [Tanacetum cinerariifolium]
MHHETSWPFPSHGLRPLETKVLILQYLGLHQIIASTQRSLVIPRRRVMILAPGQPIPHDRSYRYHPNGSVHMMTVRKRVRSLPVQQLFVRHSVNYSLSDSSSKHSSSDHSSPDLPSTSAGPSRKRRRSLMTYVPALPLVSGALSPRLVLERLELRGLPILRCQDIPEPAQKGAAEVIEDAQRELGHRIVGVEPTVTALTERVAELESDNRRLRGTAGVKSQRVDRLQRGMKIPNTRSKASMTHEEVEELVARQVAKEMEVREAARNLETLNVNEEQKERIEETEEMKMEIMKEIRMKETEEIEMEGLKEIGIMA